MFVPGGRSFVPTVFQMLSIEMKGSCWPHLDAFADDAVVREAPECDQELGRQSHDQRLARCRRSLRALPIPFGERAVLLQP